jgi:hypothetical protein
MIRKLLAIIICILLPFQSIAATVAADSCSRTDVQAALTAASRGDTVTIPAGDCTWSATVTYTKALIIKGAGAGSTIIRNGQSGCTVAQCKAGSCSQRLLSYSAGSEADALLDLPYRHEISGITFDMQYQSLGISLSNRYANFPLTQLVIENNSFINCWDCGSATADPMSYALSISGFWEGVVANNSFYGWPYIGNSATDTTGASTKNFNDADYNVQHGTEHFMFYEDNYFHSEGPSSYTDAECFILTTASGAKTVVRYNDFNCKRNKGLITKPLSPHHPVGGANVGGKAEEFYGNDLTQDYSAAWTWGTPRSGKVLAFFNKIDTPTGTIQWTMYNPTTYIPALTSYACGADVYPPWIGANYCDVTGQPEHIYRSYQFVNLYGTTGDGAPSLWSASDGGRLRNNTDYFNYNTNFGERTEGKSTGVGCGTLANRPVTCTTGVGYWATDQSCSSIGNSVGRDPATPISGTLYRCGTTDNWSAYYTPYTYPHPLRSDAPADTTAPIMSNLCAGAGSCATPIIEIPCADESEPYTVDVVVGASTNENATVKIDSSAGTNYTSGTWDATMSGGGSTTHTTTLSGLACGASYTRYLKASDTAGNITDADTTLTFTIASKAGATPTLTDLSGTTQAYSPRGQLLKVQSSVPATCRYTTGAAGTAWAGRTAFGTTGDTIQHSSSITQAASSTVNYQVLCQDTQGNESANLQVPITTTAPFAISFQGGVLLIKVFGEGDVTIDF